MKAVCGLKTNRKYNAIFSLPYIFSLDKIFFVPWDIDRLLDTAGLVRSPYSFCVSKVELKISIRDFGK
jgi:hypothetical protein